MLISLQRGLIALAVSLAAIAPAWAAGPAASTPADDDIPPGVVVEAPDSRRELLAKFQALNPGAREHVLNLSMNAYTNTEAAPGLKLRRLWVGVSGTLVEIEGLPVAGSKASAVIRQDTFAIRHAKGLSELQSVEGVSMVKDRRSGNALVVKPGEVMLALFGPVDDYRPMRVQHTPPTGQVFVYFDNIDPRFGERYRAAYQTAAAASATPEQMKDFLVEFAENDPDKKAQEIFLKLITAMRAVNTFEGYYNAYLLLQDPEDARKAGQLVRSDEHRAKMEHAAVATLADKNRLFDFDVRLDNTSTSTHEGSCFFACRYNFTALRSVRGGVSVSLRPNSPIKLKLAKYKVVLSAQVFMPRHKIRASSWYGNYNGSDDVGFTKELVVTVAPPSYSATVQSDIGTLSLAFFQRGSAGGYEGSWATSDARISVQIKSVELVP